MSTTPRPRYLDSVEDLIRQSREKIKAGRVYEARVAHDSWCGIFQGRVCNCNPVTELIEVGAPEAN